MPSTCSKNRLNNHALPVSCVYLHIWFFNIMWNHTSNEHSTFYIDRPYNYYLFDFCESIS
jgi:hypothetical protein